MLCAPRPATAEAAQPARRCAGSSRGRGEAVGLGRGRAVRRELSAVRQKAGTEPEEPGPMGPGRAAEQCRAGGASVVPGTSL